MEKGAAALEPLELIRRCREFVLHWASIQRDQFIRLGVIAEFDRPLLTMVGLRPSPLACKLLIRAGSGLRGCGAEAPSHVRRQWVTEAEGKGAALLPHVPHGAGQRRAGAAAHHRPLMPRAFPARSRV